MSINLPGFCGLLACMLLTVPTFAQQARSISVETSVMQPPVVLGRPMLTWWDVKVPGPGLVVGHFQFTVKYEEQVLLEVETEEITVNGPEQRIRVLLPPISESISYDQLKVQIAIRGKSLNEKLGEQVLRIPFATKKVFMGVIVESRLGHKRSDQHRTILEHLKFESLIQDESPEVVGEDSSEGVKTVLSPIASNDLPSDPLAYCGYDLVILLDEELRSLRKPQLEAMLAWVKAGGSLYLEPKGVLEGFHLDFLRGLAAEDPRGLVFQPDLAGRLPAETVPANEIALVVGCGLGHAAIRTDDSDRELPMDKAAWQTLTSSLWNARRQITPQHTIFRRQVVGPNGQPVLEDVPNPDPLGLKSLLGNRFRIPITDLLERLMPEGVRMVPLSVLAAILLSFVILIGPADYYVLGWLRLRKLTWITFPLATVGVTALTVWLSNSYMSAAETRRGVTIRDLDQAGETIRTNRFELLYLASSRNVSTELDKGLFSALRSNLGFDAVSFAQMQTPGMNMPVYRVDVDGQVMMVRPTFQGRVPTQYAVTQDIQKWTPQLNRVLLIPGSSEPLAVSWDEFRLTAIEVESLRRHEIPEHILASAQRQFGANVMVACFTRTDGWAYNREAAWGARQTEQLIAARTAMRRTVQFANGLMAVDQQALGEVPFFQWIYQVSVAPAAPGLFSVVKQLTPRGSAFCEDLPILDSTDPDSWLLVIVVPSEDEYMVYRKLMPVTN